MYQLIENHQDFLVISKDPEVNFHKESEQLGLMGQIKSDLSIKQLYSVHRLDKMSSGLLLFAKNQETARQLSDQFQNRKVEKYYLAISDRRPKKKQGAIKGDMEKSRSRAWKLMPTKNNPAITQFFCTFIGEGLRIFIMKPITGKTHQLRVAMKSIGAPILGDTLYKGTKADRGYLHSSYLAFTLNGTPYHFTHWPTVGEHFKSEAFMEGLKQFEQPSDLPWPKV